MEGEIIYGFPLYEIHFLQTIKREIEVATESRNTPADGVIKFSADHQYAYCPELAQYEKLEAWRQVFWRLGLIGHDPLRYDGAAYGNISLRVAGGFLVSGSQTGALPRLSQSGYAFVEDFCLADMRVTSKGDVLPSSESLTHAAILGASERVNGVVHIHSPLIWAHRSSLSVHKIPANIAYGTREMAESLNGFVESELNDGKTSGVAIMLGHEDGVISWGASIEAASAEMIAFYAAVKRKIMDSRE